MNKKVITVSILERDIKRIKKERDKTGCSMSEVIRRALSEYLDNSEKAMKKQTYEKRG